MVCLDALIFKRLFKSPFKFAHGIRVFYLVNSDFWQSRKMQRKLIREPATLQS
jgi:hypothetical protein